MFASGWGAKKSARAPQIGHFIEIVERACDDEASIAYAQATKELPSKSPMRTHALAGLQLAAMVESNLTPANQAAIRQWSNTPCGLLDISQGYNLPYFESVERDRYVRYAPWMRKYIGFDSYRGKRILEVGVGQGTDLVQFAKSGADVYGVDITPRHLEIAGRN